MKHALLLSLALTAGLGLALVPTAAADHCAERPLVEEALCVATHGSESPAVKCLWNTPPSQWGVKCLAQ